MCGQINGYPEASVLYDPSLSLTHVMKKTDERHLIVRASLALLNYACICFFSIILLSNTVNLHGFALHYDEVITPGQVRHTMDDTSPRLNSNQERLVMATSIIAVTVSLLGMIDTFCGFKSVTQVRNHWVYQQHIARYVKLTTLRKLE